MAKIDKKFVISAVIPFLGGIATGVCSYISKNDMWGTVFLIVSFILMAACVAILLYYLIGHYLHKFVDKKVALAIEALHENDIRALREAHESDIRVLRIAHENDIAALRKTRDEDLAEVKKVNYGSYQGYQMQFDKMKARLKALETKESS